METLIVYHPDCLLHDSGPMHPERADRLRYIVKALNEASFSGNLNWYEPKPIDTELIARVHTERHIENVKKTVESGASHVDDGDTGVSRDSYRAALLAAGGIVQATEKVFNEKNGRAFCAVRPPGHHARPDRAMGFCLFNNVAIASQYLLDKKGVERILIVDWDVHHGNGTEEIFFDEERVLFFSTHQYPYYPGTGGKSHRLEGGGGALNCPMNAGMGDEEYEKVFLETLKPAVDDFKPEFVFISAGFDAHWKDPLAGMKISSEGFGRLTEIVVNLAQQHADGQIVSTLEGGYNLEALAESVREHVKYLGGFDSRESLIKPQ